MTSGTNLAQALHKAVLLLDLRQDVAGAVEVLRTALAAPREPTAEGIRARVMLGELLLLSNPEEARAHLSAALEARMSASCDDVVSDELKRARQLLDQVGHQ
jgi:hypothetical protein